MQKIDRLDHIIQVPFGFYGNKDWLFIFLNDQTWIAVIEYGMYEGSGIFYDVSNPNNDFQYAIN